MPVSPRTGLYSLLWALGISLLHGQAGANADSLKQVLAQATTPLRRGEVLAQLAGATQKKPAICTPYATEAIAIARAEQVPPTTGWYQDAAYFRGIMFTAKNQGDSCILLLKPLLASVLQRGERKQSLRYHNGIANAYLRKGDAQQAETWLKQALPYAHDDESRLLLFNNLANSQSMLNQYADAFSYQIEALKLAEKLGDPAKLCMVNFGAGTILMQNKEPAQARGYLETALKWAEKTGDKSAQARCLNSLAGLLSQENKHDEAIAQLSRALPLNEALKDTQSLGVTYQLLGASYHEKRQLAEARTSMEKAVFLLERVKERKNLSIALGTLAQIAAETNEYEAANRWGKRALEMARELKSLTGQRAAAAALGTAAEKAGKYDEALTWWREAYQLRDSIFSETKNQQLQELRTRFDTEKKEGQIASLSRENKIQLLENEQQRLLNAQTQNELARERQAADLAELQALLAREESDRHIARLEQKAALEKLKNQRRSLVGLAVIATLVVAILVLGLLFTRFRARKRQELLQLELAETVKRNALERERAQAELRALQTQMNPHFIFNTLNTIQHLYASGEQVHAEDNMGRFTALTRRILEASRKPTILLEDEIDLLSSYLTLEAQRFGGNLNWNISSDDELEVEFLFLPPMLVQPYVENAIRHGLMHKTEGERRVQVHFGYADSTGKVLQCIVEDNGVGRKVTTAMREAAPGKHWSFATEATARRLELINEGRAQAIGVTYHDLEDPAGNPLGTKVVIEVPL